MASKQTAKRCRGGITILPGEDGMVVRLLDDLFLQSLKRFYAFAVQKRHVNVKDAQQAIRHVFDSRSLSIPRPPYLFCDINRNHGDEFGQYLRIDSTSLGYGVEL